MIILAIKQHDQGISGCPRAFKCWQSPVGAALPCAVQELAMKNVRNISFACESQLSYTCCDAELYASSMRSITRNAAQPNEPRLKPRLWGKGDGVALTSALI